jgi:hypothetical protein
VGGVGHVGVDLDTVRWRIVRGVRCTYTTVGTVCAPALLGSLVDLDVLDDQVAGVESLGVGVGLGVLEETEKDLGGLDGPASTGDTHGLACGKSACSFRVSHSAQFQCRLSLLLLCD